MNEDESEENLTNLEEESEKRFVSFQVILIGLLGAGATIFGFYEGSFFNTYIDHVLDLPYIYIGFMVSISAIFGLIFVLVFGTLSDNCRSKLGRRRPFLIFGGVIAGIAMCVYPFSPNYWWCFVLDAIIIGVFSNMFYGATRPLIPDLIDIGHRGRANAIVNIFSLFATLSAVGLTLVVNELYSVQKGGETVINQQGHILVLLYGGLSIIVVTIIGFFFLDEQKPSELPPPKGFFQDIRESFQYEELAKNKEFFKIIIAMTIFNIGSRIITPYLFNYVFSLGLGTIELIFAIIFIAPAVLGGSLLIGKASDTYGRKVFVTPTILISCIGFLMIPFLTPDNLISTTLLIIAVILVLFATTCLMIPLGAWQQDLLPSGKKGQFIGILNIINTVSQVPGALIGGIIADSLGINWIFAFVPIFFILSIPFFLKTNESLPEELREEIEV
ncbi:MAG: MFS transporter [Promethearchaeia archaeon]